MHSTIRIRLYLHKTLAGYTHSGYIIVKCGMKYAFTICAHCMHIVIYFYLKENLTWTRMKSINNNKTAHTHKIS